MLPPGLWGLLQSLSWDPGARSQKPQSLPRLLLVVGREVPEGRGLQALDVRGRGIGPDRTLRARHPGRAQRNKALPCPPGGGATPFSPHRLHPEAPRELERGAFQDEPSGGECEAQGTGHWDSEVGRKGCGGRDSRFSGWQGRLCPRVTLLHSNLLPQHLASKKTRILLSFPACSSSARPHPPGTPTPPSAPREAELAGPARAAAHRLRAG